MLEQSPKQGVGRLVQLLALVSDELEKLLHTLRDALWLFIGVVRVRQLMTCFRHTP